MNCKLGKLLLSVEKELAKAKSTLGHKDIDMEVSDYQPGDYFNCINKSYVTSVSTCINTYMYKLIICCSL